MSATAILNLRHEVNQSIEDLPIFRVNRRAVGLRGSVKLQRWADLPNPIDRPACMNAHPAHKLSRKISLPGLKYCRYGFGSKLDRLDRKPSTHRNPIGVITIPVLFKQNRRG